MGNGVYNNKMWICVHTIVLTGLVVAANFFPVIYEMVKEENDVGFNDKTNPKFNSLMTTFNNTASQKSQNPVSISESFVEEVQQCQWSFPALLQNIPLLNGLYVGVLCTMVLHIVLFYFQLWQPFDYKATLKEEDDKANAGPHAVHSKDTRPFC